MTSEGWTLQSVGPFSWTNYLPRMRGEGSFDAFRLRQLDCDRVADVAKITEHRFGLVNFRFQGNRAITVERAGGTHYLRGLPVALRVGGATIDATIIPAEDSDALHRRVITDKSCAVLAELVVPATPELKPEDLIKAVGNLCAVLSVMRGTKVQWIYRHDWAAAIIRTNHRAGITKAYSPLAPLDSDYDGVAATAQFITSGLAAIEISPILRRDPTVVDAYLDAKIEHDFLETRAAKIALAIEKLKHSFLQSGAAPVDEFIADDDKFTLLVTSVADAVVRMLIDGGIPIEKARLIAAPAKVYGLNRTGFRGILKGLSKSSGLAVPSLEVEFFIKCRDYLVHTGRFYSQSATEEERAKVPSPATAFDEFCFMISFLDRLYLKLFGYSGAYFDWRDFPDENKRRQLQ